MNRKMLVIVIGIATLFAFSNAANGAESEIKKKFMEALDSRNAVEMSSIVQKNMDKIPGEIEALLAEALDPKISIAGRDSIFYAAEAMANEYKNQTGDIGLLKEAKKKHFDSKLSPPVRSRPVDGVYIVEAFSPEKEKYLFNPDNIIIKKGETIRWINKDPTAHQLAAIPVIGMGGISSPKIEAGQSWEKKFEAPGEYYYFCFIHKIMYGKVTVEE